MPFPPSGTLHFFLPPALQNENPLYGADRLNCLVLLFSVTLPCLIESLSNYARRVIEMPRTKASAAKPPADPLQNYSITLASNTVPADILGGKSLANLKADIISHGGAYVTKVEQSTHLVVTQGQYDKQLNKIKEAANNPSVQIVSFDWLEATFKSNTKVNESQYLLGTATANTQNLIPAATSPPPAAQKAKRGRKAVEEDEDKPEDKPKAKKAKQVNVTRRPAALNIPLDERLPHQNYKVYIADDSTM